MELELDVRRAQFFLQLVDLADGEGLVLGRPVAQERRLDLRGVDVLERRVAVPDDARVHLGHVDRREHRERAAHAEAGDADLGAAFLQILDGAADILARRIGEVEPGHQVVRLLRIHRGLAAVEIGHQRAVAGLRQLVGHALDLIVESPPFLDHHQPGCLGRCRGLGEIAVDALAVGAVEAHGFAHRDLLAW